MAIDKALYELPQGLAAIPEAPPIEIEIEEAINYYSHHYDDNLYHPHHNSSSTNLDLLSSN